MDNHFAWWYLSNQALNVHRLTDDLITTSLHYSPKRRERFCMAEHCLQNSCFSFMAMKNYRAWPLHPAEGRALLIQHFPTLAWGTRVASSH